MDTFFEQIVYTGRDAKKTAAFIGIWLAAAALSVLLFIFLGFIPLSIFGIAALIYGAYKLSSMLYVEYEYIVTNGTVDIDRIIAKSSRKRVISFELSQVDSVERYNPAEKRTSDRKIIACGEKAPGAYKIVLSRNGKGKTEVVFAPDDRIKSAMIKFLAKFIANSAFKD